MGIITHTSFLFSDTSKLRDSRKRLASHGDVEGTSSKRLRENGKVKNDYNMLGFQCSIGFKITLFFLILERDNSGAEQLEANVVNALGTAKLYSILLIYVVIQSLHSQT